MLVLEAEDSQCFHVRRREDFAVTICVLAESSLDACSLSELSWALESPAV